MIQYSTDKALSEDLWQTALDTIDTIEMDAAFSNSLRGWIAIGVQRMIRQNRVSPPDVTLLFAYKSFAPDRLDSEISSLPYHFSQFCYF